MNFHQPCDIESRLRAAGLAGDGDFAYHESDLYVVAKPGVREWLRNNEPNMLPSYFTSPEGSGWNGAGRQCIDIPFARL